MPALLFFLTELLAKLGIFFVSYQALSFASDRALAFLKGNVGAIPPEAIGLLGLSQTDTALNIIISATITKVTLATAGKLIRFGGNA